MDKIPVSVVDGSLVVILRIKRKTYIKGYMMNKNNYKVNVSLITENISNTLNKIFNCE